ncbi:PAS domain-containing protein [Mucilaginibacter celer]|uniref:histidine kinase n=1 Tax=Mucilaginibacter celer TaxID=2305508 RepID=A0A494VUE5_9SPHI|nr:PAS domain-containing protein [Mucilaginibacter celer]AYL97989.1 PAS domain S-box protein [Mucilaginibacter celer]
MIEDKYCGAVLRAAPMPTILLKADHPAYTIAFANEAYLTLAKLTEEEIVGNGFVNLFYSHYANADEILAVLHQVLQDKVAHKHSAVRYELSAPENSGTVVKYFDIFNTPLLGANGEVELIIRTINDVTDLVVTQQNERAIYQNLVKHEKLLSESQRIANIGNWEVDVINDTILWSDVLKEIYEVPLNYQPTFESSLAFYKNDKYREIIQISVNEAIEKSNVFDAELEIITVAGNKRWLRSTGKADVIEGKCVRLYGVTQDITKFKSVEKALTESRNQYQALIESVDGIVWEANAMTFEFTYISNKIHDLLGYTPEQWLSDPNFWANHIYQDDREWAVTFCQNQTEKVSDHVFDYRMTKADGSIVWIKDFVSVIEEAGKAKLLRGVMIDFTEPKLLASLDNLEKNVLELIANKEEDLHQILNIYMRGIENLLPNMKCSALQINNNRLYTLAAPSLPTEFINALNKQPIGEEAGSCSAAAYRKEKVIAADISVDPLWKHFKDEALKHNLRSCWSYPIVNSNNQVIAVFGMYYNDVKLSGAMEILVIERAVAILKVILENRERARAIEEATMLIAQGQELANFGNWQWDIKNNVVKWSDVLYNIYGVDKKNHTATYEGYLALLHPDDREPIQNIILNALHTRKDIVFEERIIRPNGEMRYLKSWGRVFCDADGEPEKMIGSCLDITTAKIAESKLWDIAWMQSHLVRAPLVRLIGLVDLLKEERMNSGEEHELLDFIMTTARELDKVVQDISDKTVNQK